MNFRIANFRKRNSLLAAVVAGSWLLSAGVDCARAQGSYSDYYKQSLKQYGPTVGTQSPNRYLYDKYFYHNSAVSPYVNLARPDTLGGTSYQAYVRPEIERRDRQAKAESAYIQQRKMEGRVGDTRFPGAVYGDPYLKPVPTQKSNSSAYHNQWYGGWTNR